MKTTPIIYGDYKSPFDKAVYLLDRDNLFSKRFSSILIRDGAMGVELFFQDFPTSKSFDSRTIFIPLKYRNIVPKSWRQFCQLYEIQQLKHPQLRRMQSSAKRSSHLGKLFFGILGPAMENSIDFKADFTFLFSSKNERLIPKVGRHLFDSEITMRNFLEFRIAQSVTSPDLIYDDFLIHLILSNNGHVEGINSVHNRLKSFTPLSPFHGMFFKPYQ